MLSTLRAKRYPFLFHEQTLQASPYGSIFADVFGDVDGLAIRSAAVSDGPRVVTHASDSNSLGRVIEVHIRRDNHRSEIARLLPPGSPPTRPAGLPSEARFALCVEMQRKRGYSSLRFDSLRSVQRRIWARLR
jgi:hypothetical protein